MILYVKASSHPDKPYVGAGVSAVLSGVMGARAMKSGVVRNSFIIKYELILYSLCPED